jgi:hypothetical protein
MKLVVGVLIAIAAIVSGFLFQDRPYRLSAIGYGTQAALDHRDSPYSSITWVVSDADNFQQLRFFDRVEGGICLRPTWGDLISLAEREPSLSHLVPPAGTRIEPAAPGKAWPYSWQPDPGTVTNSPYIRLFPIGVLMNQALMAKAGGDPRQAAPKVLVIGLGSGIGIANLAHHFPNASITVVDIDQVVEDMVCDHYPLLAWLQTQKLPDGSPRLRLEVRDARQFVRYDARREARPYDLVILDAYTSGSTIPPHLMTVEFFAQCAGILNQDGIVFANVIGSYTGDKRRVSGGAMRSFRAAGLEHLWNFPVLLSGEGPGNFKRDRSRNNIVLCSRKPLDPRGNAAGWERLKHYVPYPQLAAGTSVSAGYILANSQSQTFLSALIPAPVIESALPNLRARLTAQTMPATVAQYPLAWSSDDRALLEQVFQAVDQAVAKGTLERLPEGWQDRAGANLLHRRETDWVLAARETFRIAVQVARDPNYSGEALVGPMEAERAAITTPNWIINDAPLFTDQMPNADIFNT